MKSDELARLQIALQVHLLNRPSAIAQEVAMGGRISVAHRLQIYLRAYRALLLENLRDAFEKTWAYLGDTEFESSALASIESNPPRHRNLRWYGADLPQWLAKQFPRDADIGGRALIDWHLRHAFDGPDAVSIGPAGLSAADWETVGFGFVPTLYIAPLRTNSASIWRALDQGQTPPVARPLPEPGWLLIWRKGRQPHFRARQAVEHAVLSQLLEGASFAQTCVFLGRQIADPEATALAAERLTTWLHDELIVGLTGVQA